jgi:hypothetical protein
VHLSFCLFLCLSVCLCVQAAADSRGEWHGGIKLPNVFDRRSPQAPLIGRWEALVPLQFPTVSERERARVRSRKREHARARKREGLITHWTLSSLTGKGKTGWSLTHAFIPPPPHTKLCKMQLMIEGALTNIPNFRSTGRQYRFSLNLRCGCQCVSVYVRGRKRESVPASILPQLQCVCTCVYMDAWMHV